MHERHEPDKALESKCSSKKGKKITGLKKGVILGKHD